MSVRTDLGDALSSVLPNTFRIITDYRDIGELPPEITGAVQLIRSTVQNLGIGRQKQTFELWVIDPHLTPELAEDSLDDNLDLVIEALEGNDWLVWTEASRTLHPGGKYEAYKMTIQHETFITP